MDTFITDVSTTKTNIAIASKTASLRFPVEDSAAMAPDSLVTGTPHPARHARHTRVPATCLSRQPPGTFA